MKFRSMILVLTIAFSAIFVSMLGTSYAYYVATDGIDLEVTTGNIDTGIAVVFEQSEYINVNTGVPVMSADVDSLVKPSIFTLNPDATILDGADVAVNIGIVDLYIDNELIVEDFKYRFVCNDGNTDVVNVNGDGLDFDETVIESGYFKLATLSNEIGYDNFDVANTYTCSLRVWLQENEDDQNDLMNKKFRGLIKVNTLFKK